MSRRSISTTGGTSVASSNKAVVRAAGPTSFVQGQEVVLVSELEAGWYRYVSEWRLHAGTIMERR